MENWSLLYEGNMDNRPVKIWRYSSGELKVETTQLQTETTEGYSEPGLTVFPTVISAGDPIEIEAETADKLLQELKVCGFSEDSANEIARLATNK